MNNAELTKHLITLDACDESLRWLGDRDSDRMWADCNRPSWLLWYAKRNGAEHKQLVRVACNIARTVLQYVPSGEDRPRICIETTERWLAGSATLEDVRLARKATAAYAAYAAYAAATAASAAYAAAYAAYAAYAADADAAADAYAAYADADADARKKQNALACSIIRDMWPTCPCLNGS